MELENFLVRAIDHGPLFWVAAGSVILGLTLITAAGIAQLRRLRGTPKTARVIEPEFKPFVTGLAPTGAAEEMPIEGAASENLGRPLSPDWAPAALENQNLQGLLTRLRLAADQLETFRRQKAPCLDPRTTSLLKEPPPAVEYVSRAGKG